TGNDTIANMITSIGNANLRKAETVRVPATNITRNIGRIPLQEGSVENLGEHWEGTNNCFLVLTLGYQGGKKKPYITALRCISRPGLRIYSNYREIPEVSGGTGMAILSTSRGIMTDREARQRQIGGEILCYVW
uniref:ribosomal protein S8 n=1 Tax=Isoetes drummondii TaxID=358750 RepID=UPI0022DCE17B